MTNKTPPLILVDGSSYLYRAYHALPPLTTSKGLASGAVKGVINMIRRLYKDYPDSPIAIVFDAKGKTFRSELYKEYKANRPPMPDDLREQVQPIHDIIRAMGLPLLSVSGVEADDVIGTLARQATQEKVDVIISTGDKDMAQLVNEHITLINTMNDTEMDHAGVIKKFGIPPELIIDFLALMGDKSDNIPGVAGVGEKTALALLQGIGGLDNIYNNLDKVCEVEVRGAKKLGAKLAIEKEQAYLSYQLATIKTDCDLEQGIKDLIPVEKDKMALLTLFQELEFKSWVEELSIDDDDSDKPNIGIEKPATHYEIILQQDQFDTWLEKLNQATLFAFDTETTSLNYMQAQIVGVSFAVEPYQAAYVPLTHDYLNAPKQLDKNAVLNALRPLLESKTQLKVGQNLKYDKHVLANEGIELNGITFDTMLESYILNSTATRHDMDSLALKYLNEKTIHFEDIAGKGAKQLTFNQIDLDQAGPYAAEDADITLRLHKTLMAELEKEETLLSVFNNIEIPLLPAITRMEENGALIDAQLLGQQSIELGQRMLELEKEAFVLADQEFNLNSPKQLQEIFFEKLCLPVIKKTPKGQPSTAEPVLQELALDYPLPKVILEYRGISKLKSTYTDKLPEMIEAKTGRVHSSFHQAVTATGRLSSSDPNLQNIPVRTEEGRRVRQAFVAAQGCQLIAADYSQIELRIMAHLSEDEGLLTAFDQGLDIHKATAAEVFSTDLCDVTTEQRRSAKAINFGLIYGMSAFGLAKQLNIGRHDAQHYIDTYFERYPGVRHYMDATRQQAHDDGYVETLFGRRLYLPNINAKNGMLRQAAERTAINAPMQGTAADIIKRAMIDADDWLIKDNISAKIIMQVHDELVIEADESQTAAITQKLCDLMSSAATLKVPLIVEAGIGNNWDEAH